MSGKTKAQLITENERLRFKVREVYAAYYDMHKLWEREEQRQIDQTEIRRSQWTNEMLRSEVDGLKEQVETLKKALGKRKKTKRNDPVSTGA